MSESAIGIYIKLGEIPIENWGGGSQSVGSPFNGANSRTHIDANIP